MNLTKIIVFLTITFLGLTQISFGQINYADLTLEILEDGTTTIQGISSIEKYQDLTSQEFTSKEKEFWIFNFTTNETFQDYIYSFKLPKGATINYLKTAKNFRITEENEQIIIIVTGEDSPIEIICQYKIDPKVNNFDESNLSYIIYIIFFIISILLGTLLHRLTTKIKKLQIPQKKSNNTQTIEKKKLKKDISILPLRQQDILKIISNKKKITQKELEELMQIPKSSISRNLKTLEIKGFIQKEKSASTNYLSLSQEIEFQ